MVLSGKAVCLCIHLTFTATVGSVLEQGEYIHTTATGLHDCCSSWITVGSVPSKDTTNYCWGITHSPKCLAAVGEGIMSSSKATLRCQPMSYYYYPSFNNNRKNHGHEITKTKRKFAEAVSDFFFRFSVQVFDLNKLSPSQGNSSARLINKKWKSDWFLMSTIEYR